MILVKNKLKRLKTDKYDEMLHYLKHSHLDNIPEDNIIVVSKDYKDKATQFPNIKNKSTQTYNKEMEDKATDTMDDLHKIDYKYKLEGDSKRVKSDDASDTKSSRGIRDKLRGDFIGNVKTVPIIDSDDENRDKENEDGDNFLSRNVKRGFRLAEFALNSSIAGANVAVSIADAIAEATINHNEEEEGDNINENDIEVVSVHSSSPITVHSSPAHTIQSSAPTHMLRDISAGASSIPVPTSPQSSRSSRSSRASPKKY